MTSNIEKIRITIACRNETTVIALGTLSVIIHTTRGENIAETE